MFFRHPVKSWLSYQSHKSQPDGSTIFLPLFILDKMNEIRFFITLFQRMLKALLSKINLFYRKNAFYCLGWMIF